jgi:hypothetical protein
LCTQKKRLLSRLTSPHLHCTSKIVVASYQRIRYTVNEISISTSQRATFQDPRCHIVQVSSSHASPRGILPGLLRDNEEKTMIVTRKLSKKSDSCFPDTIPLLTCKSKAANKRRAVSVRFRLEVLSSVDPGCSLQFGYTVDQDGSWPRNLSASLQPVCQRR